MASIAVRASATALPSSASGSAGSAPLARTSSSRPAASATAKAPIARAEPFSVCASAPASAGKSGNRADQLGRLRRKHRQHLVLEAGVAERHASEMREIDRTIIGSERRRWHPFNPFEMKRHGLIQICLPQPIADRAILASQSRNWLMKRSRDRRKFAFFLTRSCLNRPSPREFRVLVRPYATKLLTMIKNVLIAAISFASLSQ